MNLTDLSDHFLGNWEGTKELYFTGPPDPDNVSASTLVVVPIAKGKFLSFAYTWSFKDEEHEGFLLIGNGNAKGVATAAWVDSFHMSGKIMACEGAVDEQARINVLGSYEPLPDPDWGWRIEVIPKGKSLQIIMHNISPEGEEVLAVRAMYERA